MTLKPSTVRELLFRPERWTKGQNAKDKNGHSVGVTTDSAVSWCLEGAIDFVYGIDSEQAREMKDKVLAWINTQAEYMSREEEDDLGYRKFESLPSWNDSEARTFKDIRKALNATGI